MAMQAIKFLIDLSLGVAFTPLAFILRFEHKWLDYSGQILLLMGVGFFAKAFAIWAFGLHRRSWTRISVRDLEHLVLGISTVTVVYTGLACGLPFASASSTHRPRASGEPPNAPSSRARGRPAR